mgnify:CR=1 FL=1
MPRRGVSLYSLYIVIMICVRPYARIVRPHPPPGSARRRTDGRAAPPSRAQAENRAALPHIQNNAGRAPARRCFFLHKTAAGCTCLRNSPRVRDQNRRKRRSKRNAVKPRLQESPACRTGRVLPYTADMPCRYARSVRPPRRTGFMPPSSAQGLGATIRARYVPACQAAPEAGPYAE